MIALSFITSPSDPVRTRFPVPLKQFISIGRTSPPKLVYASPLTTPNSDCLLLPMKSYFLLPMYSFTFLRSIITLFTRICFERWMLLFF